MTILLWYELGAVPTLASMSALLALIPIQVQTLDVENFQSLQRSGLALDAPAGKLYPSWSRQRECKEAGKQRVGCWFLKRSEILPWGTTS